VRLDAKREYHSRPGRTSIFEGNSHRAPAAVHRALGGVGHHLRRPPPDLQNLTGSDGPLVPVSLIHSDPFNTAPIRQTQTGEEAVPAALVLAAGSLRWNIPATRACVCAIDAQVSQASALSVVGAVAKSANLRRRATVIALAYKTPH
jgi:hypothetical protein